MQRYRCNGEIHHSFSINRNPKPPLLWIEHIDGLPTRKLADELGYSRAKAFRHVEEEIRQLPDSNELTSLLCDYARFCGLLVLDAKYVKVRDYSKKIAFIYGIDYLTHDIVCSLLAPSENEQAYLKFFRLLERVRYPLRAVIADDHGAVKPAIARVFPHIPFQLCQVHYLENIRQLLHSRTTPAEREFVLVLQARVFKEHTNFERLRRVLHELMEEYASNHELRQQILLDIYARRHELFAYTKIKDCPRNTNLIELYNSHLNGRLKTIKGFKGFMSARLWLNAYVIRRRTKNLTDCGGRFKELNHHCSLELTIKKQALWPALLTKLGIPDVQKTNPK